MWLIQCIVHIFISYLYVSSASVFIPIYPVTYSLLLPTIMSEPVPAVPHMQKGQPASWMLNCPLSVYPSDKPFCLPAVMLLTAGSHATDCLKSCLFYLYLTGCFFATCGLCGNRYRAFPDTLYFTVFINGCDLLIGSAPLDRIS